MQNYNFVDQTAGGLLRLELYDVPMVRAGASSIAACIQLPYLAKNIDYEVTINYLSIVNIGTNLPASYGRKTKNAFSIYYALEGSDFNSSYTAQRIDVTINFK